MPRSVRRDKAITRHLAARVTEVLCREGAIPEDLYFGFEGDGYCGRPSCSVSDLGGGGMTPSDDIRAFLGYVDDEEPLVSLVDEGDYEDGWHPSDNF